MIPSDAPISARAPLRVSFAGGGTDLPAYYLRHDGLVVSTAITRYARVMARDPGEPVIRIDSADYRSSLRWPAGACPPPGKRLTLPKAAIDHFIDRGLRERGIHLDLECDVPPGTGLGSSSAMAVALVVAIAAYLGIAMTPAETAEAACAIELERLGMPIGKQDQYASSFGGLNAIAFTPSRVAVSPLRVDGLILSRLSERLLLFSTGRSRSSAEILRRQSQDSAHDPAVIERLHQLKSLAREIRRALEHGDLDDVGERLHAAWMAKRRLCSSISNSEIDRAYARARAAGALGGKIAGAGGGGYLLLYCPPERHQTLRLVMADAGFPELQFGLERAGADVAALHSLPAPAVPA